MKALLVVAGIAAAVALASGLLLLRAMPAGGAVPAAAAPGGARRDRAVEELLERIARLEERLAAAEARAPAPPPPPPPAPARPDATEDAPASADAPAPDGLPGEPASPAGRVDETVGRILEVPTTGRDREIRRIAARAAEAVGLGDGERLRYEEILRAHAGKCDALAARAREALKDTLHGYSAAERAALAVLEQERKRVDAETQQALSDLVGRERWQRKLQAEKDQQAKERALRRLETPW